MEASVGRRFSRAAESYDRAGRVQQRVAAELRRRVGSIHDAAEMLEIGVGTGVLTEPLLHDFPQARLTAIDCSKQMLGVLRARLNGEERLQTICASFEEFPETRCYDRILSSSALHWCPDLAQVFAKCFRLLRTGGMIEMALMVEGTLGELIRLRSELFPNNIPQAKLPTSKHVVSCFSKAAFENIGMEEIAFAEYYSDTRALFQALHETGVTSGRFSRGQRPLGRSELNLLRERYDTLYRGERGVVAHYKVLFLSGRK